jgi:hypothetical protein
LVDRYATPEAALSILDTARIFDPLSTKTRSGDFFIGSAARTELCRYLIDESLQKKGFQLFASGKS